MVVRNCENYLSQLNILQVILISKPLLNCAGSFFCKILKKLLLTIGNSKLILNIKFLTKDFSERILKIRMKKIKRVTHILV